jgi:hypothetical protein
MPCHATARNCRAVVTILSLLIMQVKLSQSAKLSVNIFQIRIVAEVAAWE